MKHPNSRGVLAKYAAHFTSASFGAVTDMVLKLQGVALPVPASPD